MKAPYMVNISLASNDLSVLRTIEAILIGEASITACFTWIKDDSKDFFQEMKDIHDAQSIPPQQIIEPAKQKFTRKRWTQAEAIELAHMLKINMPFEDIAQRTGRTIEAIERKAALLGLWTSRTIVRHSSHKHPLTIL